MRSTHPALHYIRDLYAQEDALLREIRERLSAELIDWQVGAEEGKLLQLLVLLRGVRTIVEVGTLAGYSAIWMARGLPEGGMLHAINKDPAHAAMAEKFFERSDVRGKITQHVGDAHDVLPGLSGQGPFDMIFIDADKISYPDYLDWAETNIRPGGLIVGDNTLLFGAAYEDAPPEGTSPGAWKAMRSFNERLADKSKYQALMVPTEQGLSVAVKLG